MFYRYSIDVSKLVHRVLILVFTLIGSCMQKIVKCPVNAVLMLAHLVLLLQAGDCELAHLALLYVHANKWAFLL